MADGYSTRDRAPHQGRGSKTSPSSSPEGARDKGSGMSRRVEAQGKGSAFVRGSDGEHPAGNQRRRACMRELSGCSPVRALSAGQQRRRTGAAVPLPEQCLGVQPDLLQPGGPVRVLCQVVILHPRAGAKKDGGGVTLGSKSPPSRPPAPSRAPPSRHGQRPSSCRTPPPAAAARTPRRRGNPRTPRRRPRGHRHCLCPPPPPPPRRSRFCGAPPPGWRRRLACCLQKRPAISSESGDA